MGELIVSAIIGSLVIMGIYWFMELVNNQPISRPVLSESRNIDKEKCFSEGGVRFEVGTSGGGQHNVCVFEK